MKSIPALRKLEILFPGKAILTWIIVFSVLIRVIVSVYLGEQIIDLPGTADQISYHSLAVRVLEGHGFSFDTQWWPATAAGAPTAHWSFLYTFFLVFIYGIFGVHPIIARLIQAVIVGILQPYLAYWIGKNLFHLRVGWIAAGITAIYTYFVYYSGCLLTEPFYIVSTLGTIALLIKISRPDNEGTKNNKWGLYFWLGILFTVSILLRQLFILLVPIFLAWILWVKRKQGLLKLAGQIGLTCGIIVAAILPITFTNYQRFDRFVLLNTNSGYAFYFGNHPIYGTKFVPILTPEMGTYQQLIPTDLLVLNEAQLDQELLKLGFQFVLADPQRYLLLSLSRIPVYFQFWPSQDSGTISNISRVTSFGIFFPFMIYGLILAVRNNAFKKLSNPAWPLLLFIVIYSGIHILSWTLIRYRLPVDAIAIIFAALSLYNLANRLFGKYNPHYSSE